MCDCTNGSVQDERHVIEDCTKMNELRFKYIALNFTYLIFYKDEAKACDHVYDATQLLQISIDMVAMFVNK